MKRSRPVSLALVGLFVWVTGCTSHRVIPVEEVAQHGKVRITLVSGERETFRDPWIDGDSIKGRVYLPPAVYGLDEVAGVEAVGTDEVGTFFTALGLLAVVLVGSCAASSCLDNP